MKITWKDRTGKYTHTKYCMLNRFKVAHVAWTLCKGVNGESYEVKFYLPGIESRTVFHTEEGAKQFAEIKVTAWMALAVQD